MSINISPQRSRESKPIANSSDTNTRKMKLSFKYLMCDAVLQCAIFAITTKSVTSKKQQTTNLQNIAFIAIQYNCGHAF